MYRKKEKDQKKERAAEAASRRQGSRREGTQPLAQPGSSGLWCRWAVTILLLIVAFLIAVHVQFDPLAASAFSILAHSTRLDCDSFNVILSESKRLDSCVLRFDSICILCNYMWFDRNYMWFDRIRFFNSMWFCAIHRHSGWFDVIRSRSIF